MNLIICVDDNNGIMFNNRRQSQDRELRKRILKLTEGKKLWMSSYSAKQFESDNANNIVVSDSFLSEAEPGDFCFAEDADTTAAIVSAEKLILFRWNRSYPYDRTFDLDKGNWVLTQTTDFVGYSHEKISEEVYDRK